MKKPFKTLWDVDFVLCWSSGIQMPLRNLVGEPAMKLFQDLHLIHLININSKKNVIPFNIDFKRFLGEQTGFSIRKIEYLIKKLIADGRVIKEDRVYTLSKEFSDLFKMESREKDELPWKDQPNYN